MHWKARRDTLVRKFTTKPSYTSPCSPPPLVEAVPGFSVPENQQLKPA